MQRAYHGLSSTCPLQLGGHWQVLEEKTLSCFPQKSQTKTPCINVKPYLRTLRVASEIATTADDGDAASAVRLRNATIGSAQRATVIPNQVKRRPWEHTFLLIVKKSCSSKDSGNWKHHRAYIYSSSPLCIKLLRYDVPLTGLQTSVKYNLPKSMEIFLRNIYNGRWDFTKKTLWKGYWVNQCTVIVSWPMRIKTAVRLLISASKILLPKGSCTIPATTADFCTGHLRAQLLPIKILWIHRQKLNFSSYNTI